jgi:hypothetical protein
VKKTESGLTDDNLPFAAVLLTICSVFAFAFWTLACHVCVVFGLSFRALTHIGPAALVAGIACGVFAAQSTQRHSSSPFLSSESQQSSWTWTAIALAVAIVAAHKLGLGYSAFWIASFLLLSFALIKEMRTCSVLTERPRPIVSKHKAVLLTLIIVAPAITYLSHRPNIDDAVYVGTAADAVAHPELPVLSHDVLYGDQKFPLMLPSYALESYELFVGFLARLFGTEPILLAHAFLPTALAVLVPIAWAGLMRILVTRDWAAATVIALIALVVSAGSRGFGYFAFGGLFVGKSVLVSVGVPLLYTYAWKFEESGLLWEWLILAAISIGCVGLSASAVFIVPLGLAMAALAGRRKENGWRAALTLLPALYPSACGLSIARSARALEGVFAYLPARADLAVNMAFGARTEDVFLLALLAAPFLARNGRWRRRLIILVLAYFLVALNPFTFKLLSRFTTRDAVWRVLWCMPVAGIVAMATVRAFEAVAERWGKRGIIIAALPLLWGLVYLVPYSSLASSNGDAYSLRPLKVNAPDYAAARDAIAATPPKTSVLAPANVAVWIPTFVHRVPIVSVRDIYDEEMGTHLAPEDARMRRELRELVSGKEFPPEQREALLNALPVYSVGLIITTEPAADQLGESLSKRGYSRIRESAGYAFFRRIPGNISSIQKNTAMVFTVRERGNKFANIDE